LIEQKVTATGASYKSKIKQKLD